MGDKLKKKVENTYLW